MPPTEQSSPVSRRKLGMFAVAAGIVALLVVVTGIRAREDSSARLREWTDNQADSDGRGGAARCQGSQRDHRSAGPAGSLLPRADLCARQRLPEKLERRHRRAGQGRAGDRRNRGAGPRPAIAAGARRSRQPAGEREIVRSHAEPPQIADRLEFRFDAGNRRAHRRPLQQEGRGQFRPGQCRTARGAGRLQEDHRAIRRRGHRPRHRRRRADQCRRRLRAADVRGLRHQQAAGLCQRSPELRARDQDRRQGRDLDAGISEPDFCRHRRGLLAIGRCRLRHHADAARARQCRRRVDAGRLCQCAHEPAARRRAAAYSGQRADLQPERPAGCDRRGGRQGAVQDRDHRPRSRHAISNWRRASRRRTASSSRRRTALADGDQVRVAGAPRASPRRSRKGRM